MSRDCTSREMSLEEYLESNMKYKKHKVWRDFNELNARINELENEIELLLIPVYCPVCGNCGEEGCCGTKRCLYPQDTPETLEYLDELEDKLERLNG